MNITAANLDSIWRGITVMAGGGGGDPATAREDLEASVSFPVEILALDDLPSDATVITAFGVGSVGAEEEDRLAALEQAIDVFRERCGISPDAVMPVEVGAGTVAEAGIVADLLDIPLVDADHVGRRCAPDIQCETITLAGLDRTPLIAASSSEVRVIRTAEDGTAIEAALRSFAGDGTRYVIGYPLDAGQLRGTVVEGWTDSAALYGRALAGDRFETVPGVEVLASGHVITVDLQDINGFTVGRIRVDTGESRYDVYVKNENLLLLRDGEQVAAAPDNIVLLDMERSRGLYNGAPPAPGTAVSIATVAAATPWSTGEGQQLFAPENLGFSIRDAVVEYKDITRWTR
ncbi:MAG: DUF917 family protein [Candidatus Nanohaloarchaea archaeon]|nr:DUF917 family protein [Candidatus Nanohaloarchaea archaeon]